MGAKIEDTPRGPRPYCFKISGEVFHLATSALVQAAAGEQNPTPRYGQLFVYDPEAAVRFWMNVRENSDCVITIMASIDAILRRVNPYVERYRQLDEAAAHEAERARAEGAEPRRLELQLIRDPRDDQRRYNAPVTTKEYMMLIPGADGNVEAFNLAVHPRDERGCQRLRQFNPHIDPMVFPLLFPLGNSGWTFVPGPRKEIMAVQFYCSRIAVRGDFNPLHHAGKLYQQYLVHAYCTVEADRLQYVKTHHKDLRAQRYQGLIWRTRWKNRISVRGIWSFCQRRSSAVHATCGTTTTTP